MELDADRCYEAITARDQRFDGAFFTGVTSTGVYCRPVCPARTPKRANVRFFRHSAAAEEAGFRACRRCRPESAPGSAAWDPAGDIVGRAIGLIDDGLLDDGAVTTLAARLAVTPRHLRRLFVERLGTTPVAVARTRRAHLARRLLDETDLAVTDIAFAAGFGSIRQFNDVMRASFGAAPSELRRRGATARAAPERPLTVRLPFRSPLDWRATIEVLSLKTTAGVEVVDGETYRRTVPTGWVAVRPGGDSHLLLEVHVGEIHRLTRLVARARTLFDLDADAETIAGHLRRDPLLTDVVDRHPGLRLVGAWDGFETAVRIVLGQLVSVRGATTIAGRLAAAHGEPATEGGPPDLRWHFPTPEAVIDQELEAVGMTRAKATAIRGLAAAVLSGDISLDAAMPADELGHRLVELPGIGPWTADMVRMRVSRDPDGFAPGDLGIRRALGDVSAAVAEERSRPWRPWRAYAAMYLWRLLTAPPVDPTEERAP